MPECEKVRNSIFWRRGTKSTSFFLAHVSSTEWDARNFVGDYVRNLCLFLEQVCCADVMGQSAHWTPRSLPSSLYLIRSDGQLTKKNLVKLN